MGERPVRDGQRSIPDFAALYPLVPLLSESDHAMALHKRVIPMLIESVPPEKLPKPRQKLHYIDLTDNYTGADYQKDNSILLRILNQKVVYEESQDLREASSILA